MGRKRKRVKKIVKKFYDEVFKVEVTFLNGHKPEDVNKWFEKNNIEKDDDIDIVYDNGGLWKTEGHGLILWVKEFADYYVITHEAVHLVYEIMNNKGIPINRENDEVVSYMVEYWVRTLWRHVSKYD